MLFRSLMLAECAWPIPHGLLVGGIVILHSQHFHPGLVKQQKVEEEMMGSTPPPPSSQLINTTLLTSLTRFLEGGREGKNDRKRHTDILNFVSLTETGIQERERKRDGSDAFT